MLTEEQRKTFNLILEANQGCDHAVKRNDQTAFLFCDTFRDIQTRILINSMGQEAYDTFINQGKKLFANTKN